MNDRPVDCPFFILHPSGFILAVRSASNDLFDPGVPVITPVNVLCSAVSVFALLFRSLAHKC